MLLNMRTQRMGLIQTEDQLRQEIKEYFQTTLCKSSHIFFTTMVLKFTSNFISQKIGIILFLFHEPFMMKVVGKGGGVNKFCNERRALFKIELHFPLQCRVHKRLLFLSRFSVSAILVGCTRMNSSDVIVNGAGSKPTCDPVNVDRPAGKRLSVSSHSPPSSKKRKNSDS